MRIIAEKVKDGWLVKKIITDILNYESAVYDFMRWNGTKVISRKKNDKGEVIKIIAENKEG